jgi:hypothetical protein
MRSNDAVGAVCTVFVAMIDVAYCGSGGWSWYRRNSLLHIFFLFSFIRHLSVGPYETSASFAIANLVSC